jgi:hypothetical protein
LTCGYESYVLSGRSTFSKADLDARHASLHSRFQAHAVRLYIRVFVEGRRNVFHSTPIKELTKKQILWEKSILSYTFAIF